MKRAKNLTKKRTGLEFDFIKELFLKLSFPTLIFSCLALDAISMKSVAVKAAFMVKLVKKSVINVFVNSLFIFC